MKSVSVIVLVSFVIFVAAVEKTSLTKVIPSMKLITYDPSDVLALAVYMMGCSDAFTHQSNCLAEHSNYNPDPVGDAETCEMGRLELNCLDSLFAATTCAGKQDAIDAVGRMRSTVESVCSSLGIAATSLVTRFFTVIIMTSVFLL